MTELEAIKIVRQSIDGKIINSGTAGIIQAALLKRIPVRPRPDKQYYGNGVCPSCGAVFLDQSTKYCGNCGQCLDWGTKSSEEES